MSIEAMSWVINCSEERLGRRLVMISLANYAAKDGSRAFPAVETIAQDARMSVRQVYNCLRDLEAAGSIIRTGVTQRGVIVYRIAGMQDLQVKNPTPDLQNRAGGGSDIAPDPSLEPAEPSDLLLQDAPEAAPSFPLATVDRKPVSAWEAELALGILAAFNEKAGTRYRSAEYLRGIVGRIREHPDLTLSDHVSIIVRNLANPWWNDEAAPNVVYGNEATFDRAMHRVEGKQGGKPGSAFAGDLRRFDVE